MKIKLSILFIFLIVFIHSNATIRRVGYTATIQAVNNIDYVNFQAAHDAASNNDTIQLYPGTSNSTTYTGTITKPLFILGVGYYTNSFYISGTEIANSNLQNLAGLIKGFSNKNAYEIATAYAYRNDFDNTIRWLERAYAQGERPLQLASVEPGLMAKGL